MAIDNEIRRMRSVIVYGIHTLNVGDDLFLKVLLERYPSIRFIVHAPEVYKRVFLGHKNLKVVSESDGVIRCLAFLSKCFHVSLSKLLYFYLIIKYHVGIFVIIGGSLFIEGNSNMPRLLFSLGRFRKLKQSLKVCIIGTNYGPSKSASWQNVVSDALSIADDVCFRDKPSYDTFAKLSNVRWGNDIVFHSSFPTILNKRKEICVNIRSVDSWPTLKPFKKRYLEVTKGLIEDFQRKGYGVNILSFCEKYGDNVISDELFDQLQSKQKVNRIYYSGNLAEITDVIAASEYMIATRFHAIILGLFYDVKILPVSYSIKSENMLKTLGFWRDIYDFERYCNSSLITLKEEFISDYCVNKDNNTQFDYLDKVLS